jgi:hypothetical protein
MTKSPATRPAGDGQKYCPRCTTMMVLERVAPKFGPLPEMRTYKCLQCGCVVEEDIELD